MPLVLQEFEKLREEIETLAGNNVEPSQQVAGLQEQSQHSRHQRDPGVVDETNDEVCRQHRLDNMLDLFLFDYALRFKQLISCYR